MPLRLNIPISSPAYCLIRTHDPQETDDAGDKHVEAPSEQIRGFEW